MLALHLYGRACRVCLRKSDKLIGLNDTNNEYSITIVEMLHQSMPSLKERTEFPVPQEICESCREQLFVVYKFQQICMATMKEMLKMWQESQRSEIQLKPFYVDKEKKEQEITLNLDLEFDKKMDPIKLEDTANEDQLIYKVKDTEREKENSEEAPCNTLFKCNICLKICCSRVTLQKHINRNHKEILYKDLYSEDDDDKPLICLRNKRKPARTKGVRGLDMDKMEQVPKNSRRQCSSISLKKKQIGCKKGTKFVLLAGTESEKTSSIPPVNDIPILENVSDNNEFKEFETCSEQEDCRESDLSSSKSIENEIKTKEDSSFPHGKIKTYDCKECNASFRFEKQLERHVKKHTEAYRFVCPMCSDRFKYPFLLQKHVLKHHSEGSTEPKEEKIKESMQEKVHACNYCSSAYSKIGGLAQHMSKKHPEIVPFKCNKCNKTFVVEEHLKIHSNRHMGIKNFKCDLCDKSFSFKFAMKQHMRIHTGDLNYLCTLCGKKFYRPSNLRQHMQRHGDDKPYSCTHCPKRFKCPSDRYIHLKSHETGKNHVCATCGSRFSRVDTLHQHQILHTGEKPYKCDQCPRAFPRLMNLNRHLRTHTGEKPYKCKYCDKAYAQSNDLNKHLRTHVGENTYMCSECPAAFKYQADLRNHGWEHYRKKQQEEQELQQGHLENNYENKERIIKMRTDEVEAEKCDRLSVAL